MQRTRANTGHDLYIYKKLMLGYPGLLDKRNWIFKGVQIYLTFSLSVKWFYIKIVYIYMGNSYTCSYKMLHCPPMCLMAKQLSNFDNKIASRVSNIYCIFDKK